jgi:rhodanese-related sulfurtransferase
MKTILKGGVKLEYVNYVLIAIIAFVFIKRLIPVKGIRHISTGELKNELKDKNKQFIDVRTPGEFKGNHIKGFNNLPLHQLAQKAQGLDKAKEVVVICQSGMRSQKACNQLKKLGFTNITNVQGGVSAWRP